MRRAPARPAAAGGAARCTVLLRRPAPALWAGQGRGRGRALSKTFIVQRACTSEIRAWSVGPTDLLKDLDDAAQVPALRSQRRVASGGEHRPWAISVLFLLAALALPHATQWLTAFEALAAAVTLVMVFALQHTQVRQQAAVQRKLGRRGTISVCGPL